MKQYPLPHLAVSAAALLCAGFLSGEAAHAATDALIADPGTIEVRGRLMAVVPDMSTQSISVIGGHATASNSLEPELDATYFFTRDLAVEAIAGITRHKITATGTALGTVGLGHVTLLPPTITAQYHLHPTDRLDAYLGAGVNYTVFFDHNLPGGGSPVTKITYQNNFGEAIQAGLDLGLTDRWVLNLDVKHIFLDTKVKLNGGVIVAKVDVDPTILGIGVGYRF